MINIKKIGHSMANWNALNAKKAKKEKVKNHALS